MPPATDDSTPHALFVTLPGWEGLHFQGVGENLRWEKFAQQAMSRDSQMIVLAPQLDDWGQTSADRTIELVEARTPTRLFTGRDDSYYGSESFVQTADKLRERYAREGLGKEAIDALVILDVKEEGYFAERGYTDQHAGGGAAATDDDAMGWLFSHRREEG